MRSNSFSHQDAATGGLLRWLNQIDTAENDLNNAYADWGVPSPGAGVIRSRSVTWTSANPQ